MVTSPSLRTGVTTTAVVPHMEVDITYRMGFVTSEAHSALRQGGMANFHYCHHNYLNDSHSSCSCVQPSALPATAEMESQSIGTHPPQAAQHQHQGRSYALQPGLMEHISTSVNRLLMFVSSIFVDISSRQPELPISAQRRGPATREE